MSDVNLIRRIEAVLIVAPIIVLGTVLAPLVSMVALPIFVAKALFHWVQHNCFYERTLTNLTREKFGRIPGQDYTRWDGRSVESLNAVPSKQDQMHELIGSYVHGFPEFFRTKSAECPFDSQVDLEWFRREFIRRQTKDLLDQDMKMVRAFAKALIPIIGFFWVLATELSIGGASQFGCTVCSMGLGAQDAHWDWRDAIYFHAKNLGCNYEAFNKSIS